MGETTYDSSSKPYSRSRIHSILWSSCSRVSHLWNLSYVCPGKKELRDQIDEHAKMHELGIAHGHGGNKEAYEMSGKLKHNHDKD